MALLALWPSLLALSLQPSRRATCGLALAQLCALRPALAADSGDEAVRKLSSALGALEDLIREWPELTIDCNYGEIDRTLLGADSKQSLLQQASSTSKSATMVVKCKSTGRLVRERLGPNGPLARIGALLERPAIVQRVDDSAAERFQEATEQLQQALLAADTAAYLSTSGDFSAQTAFARGEPASAPNLDRAKDAAREARDLLREISSLVR